MVKKVDRSVCAQVFEKYAMSETAYSGEKYAGKLIGRSVSSTGSLATVERA